MRTDCSHTSSQNKSPQYEHTGKMNSSVAQELQGSKTFAPEAQKQPKALAEVEPEAKRHRILGLEGLGLKALSTRMLAKRDKVAFAALAGQ